MYQKILDTIKEYSVITIFRHVLPDGDAFGSQFGLKEIIKENFPDKEVYAVGSNPGGTFKYLFPMSDIVEDDKIKESLAIVLDTSNSPRVEDQRYALAKKVIKIDHHPETEKYGEFQLVDTSKSACAEIIADWALDQNLNITAEGAKYLFIGITTDSGRMLYNSVNARTYQIMGELSKRPFERSKVYDILYLQSADDVKLKGYIQAHFTLTSEGVAYLKLTKEILKELNSNQGAASLVNTLANIEDIDTNVLFAESEEGKIRCELRSKLIAVNIIATKYGGGGHKFAAGAMVDSFDIVDQMIADLALASKQEREARILEVGKKALVEASKEVNLLYNNQLDILIKEDQSPVTNADLKANEIIIRIIKETFPFHQILSEENSDDSARLRSRNLWIIDPIDGTEDFIKHTDEFAINVAYIRNNELTISFVAAPAKGILYYAIKDQGAYKVPLNDLNDIKKISANSNKKEKLIAAISRNHFKEEEKALLTSRKEITEIKPIGSAYKLCLVAEGLVDIVYKVGAGTKEWDIAAPDLIIKEASGVMVDGDFQEFIYNRADVRNLKGYIALGNKDNLKLFKK